MMQEVTNPTDSSAIGAGHQTFVGSSSVGSRLAGLEEEAQPPSVTNGSNDGNYQPFANPKDSPIYTPNQVKSNSYGFNSMNKNGSAPASKFKNNVSMQAVTQVAMEKAEILKTWSVKTYKCTKQILAEKLGRGTRTIDVELEAKIEVLRDTKRKYENLVAVSQALNNHVANMVQVQRLLGEAFNELSLKSKELQEDFRYNADTQQVLVKNGENLLAAINFFISGITTLCQKTMEDTLITISRYEQARLEYDAYRTEVETLNIAPRTEANIAKLGAAQVNFGRQKDVYDKLRGDVTVKLQFLDENRVKVMQKHLLLFHNAITAFFAGNQQMLEATLKQFSVTTSKAPGQSSSSFLENE